MAITRRQFVTRLGALAAAAGFTSTQASQIMDALAWDNPGVYQGTFGKPRVVWIHGAECTGCSTSLLGIFENVNGAALYNSNATTAYTTVGALDLTGALPFDVDPPLTGVPNSNEFTYHRLGVSPDQQYGTSMDIADVVVDVIDLLYHETVMGAGGDLAYKWLKNFQASNTKPFVLVVEGALQWKDNGGAWDDSSVASKAVSWCSIGMNGTTNGTGEIDMPEMVKSLADKDQCAAVIGIGQCATFGGYPGCKPPISTATAGFDTSKSQTDALGLYDFLEAHSAISPKSSNKVVAVPGCPTNPWWFVLTVVAWLVDFHATAGKTVGTVGPLGILQTTAALGTPGYGVTIVGGVDGSRRLTAVYGNPIHSPLCPRYRYYTRGIFATYPGDPGCLQKIGCKGPAAKSLCGVHGWNNQQPTNDTGVAAVDSWDYGTPNANRAPNGTTATGGHCTRAGHPCMACTERGYPDNFVPFVVR